jgi:ABC-type transport system substrate-binding protein
MACADYAFMYLYQYAGYGFRANRFEGWNESASYNPLSSYPNLQFINKMNGSALAPADTFVDWTIGWCDPLDTASNYESFGSGINELCRETLLRYNSSSDYAAIEPSLATGYDISADGKNITFTLRPGVTFHDGSPFNAYVMKYSMDRAMIMNDPSGASWMITPNLLGGDYYSLGDPNVTEAIEFATAGGIEVIDDYTIRVCQAIPYVPMLYALQYNVMAAVSPKDVIGATPADYVTDSNSATYHEYGMIPLTDWFPELTEAEIRTKLGLDPAANLNISGVVPGSGMDLDNAPEGMHETCIGTGPYELTTFDTTGWTMEFEKNVNWWDNGSFAPQSVDYIKIVGKQDNAETRVSALLAGDIDIGSIPTTHFNLVTETDGSPKPGLVKIFNKGLTTGMIGFTMYDDVSAEFIKAEEPVTTTSEEEAGLIPGFTASVFLTAISLSTLVVIIRRRR